MSAPIGLGRRTPSVDRSADRVVALVALGLALLFLVAAAAAAFLPPAVRRGVWLPLHLALAGGATTAIAGVMPFFVAAFAAAPPSDVRLRFSAVLAIALGAVGICTGVAGGSNGVAVFGAAAFIGGILLTGIAALRPLGGALGPSRGLVTQGYLLALADVSVGAVLATLFVAGWPPVLAGWAGLKGSHAWLNLVGFVSLTIATTLLHFFPTVVGARIVVGPSTRLTVAGIGAGAALAAIALAIGGDVIAYVAAFALLAGALGLAVYVARTWRAKARWTTDAGWHRFAMGGLVSAVAWFEIGIAIAAGRLLAFGGRPASWSLDDVGGPLVAGWMGLALVASATHLVPAVGPGDPTTHARQRAVLGRVAGPRLVAANAGVAALSAGLSLHADVLAVLGIAIVGLALASTALLIAAAVRIGQVGVSRRRSDRGEPLGDEA